MNFINKNINPKHVGELPLNIFLKKRKLIKKFTLSQLDILDDINIINIGNYLLNGTYINKNSIVYSFGIGESISLKSLYQINLIAKYLLIQRHWLLIL